MKHTTSRRPGATLARGVFARDPAKCVYCGAVEELTLDHVVSWARGGESTAENLVVACAPCNTEKGSWPVHFFAMLLEHDGRGVGHEILTRVAASLARPIPELPCPIRPSTRAPLPSTLPRGASTLAPSS